MSDSKIQIRVVKSVVDVDPADWNACACPERARPSRPMDPFTTHVFLSALEQSGSVGPGTGWTSRPLVASLDDQVIAVAPLYVKTHSQGEYVFDHAWAHAYESAGGEYYPKLQITVPFTPASGRRLLTRPGYEDIGQSALLQGAIELAANNQFSSLHVTFCTESEAQNGQKKGLMYRHGQQFHWNNAGYRTFADFTAALSSRKRKNIRRERKAAADFGGEILSLTGDEIQNEHWQAFWQFYQSTGARKWGSPYLTRSFFDLVHEHMRDDVLLIMARKDGEYVAGALNFIGRDTLFGRYWGCTEYHPALHFELCYYRAIDYAIEHGMTKVEAGAQGEHKLARGYLPVTTQSLHWVADPGFRRAIEQYLSDERAAVGEENEHIAALGPFRKADPD